MLGVQIAPVLLRSWRNAQIRTEMWGYHRICKQIVVRARSLDVRNHLLHELPATAGAYNAFPKCKPCDFIVWSCYMSQKPFLFKLAPRCCKYIPFRTFSSKCQTSFVCATASYLKLSCDVMACLGARSGLPAPLSYIHVSKLRYVMV